MKVTMRPDDRVFQRKMVAVRGALPYSETVAVAAMGIAFLDVLIPITPRRTHRMVRGFQMARNDLARYDPTAGAAPLDPLIRDDDFHAVGRLTEQLEKAQARVAYWQGIVEGYETRPGPKTDRGHAPTSWKSYRDAQRTLRKYEKQRDRAAEILAQFQGADPDAPVLFIGGRKNLKSTSLRRLTTVRLEAYGGRAEIVDSPRGKLAEIVNMEPHARWVDRRTRLGARARALGRAYGLEAVRTSFLRQVRAAQAAAAPPAG